MVASVTRSPIKNFLQFPLFDIESLSLKPNGLVGAKKRFNVSTALAGAGAAYGLYALGCGALGEPGDMVKYIGRAALAALWTGAFGTVGLGGIKNDKGDVDDVWNMHVNPPSPDQIKPFDKFVFPEQTHILINEAVTKTGKEGVSLLFYGSPGNGKTGAAVNLKDLLAKQTGKKVDVHETDSNMCSVNPSEVIGLSQKSAFSTELDAADKIKALLKRAKELHDETGNIQLVVIEEAGALVSGQFGAEFRSPLANKLTTILEDFKRHCPGVVAVLTTNSRNISDHFIDGRRIQPVPFRDPSFGQRAELITQVFNSRLKQSGVSLSVREQTVKNLLSDPKYNISYVNSGEVIKLTNDAFNGFIAGKGGKNIGRLFNCLRDVIKQGVKNNKFVTGQVYGKRYQKMYGNAA